MSGACGGWGQAWGSIPWGGSICPPPDTGGVAGWGPGFDRVYREREWRREQREERNVLFKVEGVECAASVGRVRIEIRPYVEIPPAPEVFDGSIESFVVPQAMACSCGAVKVRAGGRVSLEGVEASAEVGTPSVRTIRNPTDEELLMMIAELA